MNCQDIFQCLKGVGQIDLSDLVLPISGTQYALYPVDCRVGYADAHVIDMLTKARNANPNSFLTFFSATPERTRSWLAQQVATDRSRILFALKDTTLNKLYGYMGLAYGDTNCNKIEGDAIVRYGDKAVPGLMRLAFLSLVQWTFKSLGIREVWVRVLSDNPAVAFYKRCNFVALSESILYEVRNSEGVLEALTEIPSRHDLPVSRRTIIYMKYSPSEKPALPNLSKK
jgi:hypothetical protein